MAEIFNWKRKPQLQLSLDDELVVDNFAGGGGASMGIEQALGRGVDIAINHDPKAIAMHKANHPQTRHYCEDVFKVDPAEVCQGRPVGLAWFSPDCTHHSKAKGGKPRDKNIRGLAWVAVKWAKLVRPRIIMLENVEEFGDWGPLLDNGKPCPDRKGMTFRRFLKRFENLGYNVEYRMLRACDYGAPTIRKRLFLIARCDGQPIVWPEPTHGQDRIPYLTAADCIDWSLPCYSIFLTKEQVKKHKLKVKRPLAEATLKRVAKGVHRYVLESADPFIVPIAHYNGTAVAHDINEPLRTVTAYPKGGTFAVVSPTLIQTGFGERPGQSPRVPGLDKPLGTVMAGGSKHALVAAFLAKHYTGVVGQGLEQPAGTVTSIDHHSLVASHLAILRNNCDARDLREPLSTVCTSRGHFAEVRAFLLKYNGTDQDANLREPMHTVTTKDRFGIVTVHGQDYQIIDIGMRMLQPRELYRANGFHDEYIIDLQYAGKLFSKADQVRMCGNSVPPVFSRALVEANYKQNVNYRSKVR